MSEPSSGRDPVEELAEEFAERYRRGERPSVADYTDKYPELAEQIRELFPALVVMEQLGSVAGPPAGPFDPKAGEGGELPQQLGDYRILREVGRGGMGVVYEAVQESLGRHVALKILPFHRLLDPLHLERFRREARAAAQLHHTNIVPVFGVGEAEGIHYYAMQFIQGQGLDVVLGEVRRLRGRKSRAAVEGKQPACDLSLSIVQGLLTGRFKEVPPSGCHAFGAPEVGAIPRNPLGAAKACHPAESNSANGAAAGSAEMQSDLGSQTEWQYCRSVAQVGVQVAEALAYAHKERILHRDIKPSNLLLDTRGTVWITDFGLAKAEGSDDLTSPGDIVGTLRFMAPERFQGKADPRSDLYSLGITLYEMLTLRPAFVDANRARLVERVTHEEPRGLRELDPHVPRDLETIVQKAIAKEPADRYPSAETFAEDLRRFLNNEPIHARPVGPVEMGWRWCRRNPAVATLLASIVFLLLVLGVGSSLAAALWREQRDTALTNLERAERAEKDKTEKLWQSYRDQARVGRWSDQVGRRFNSLQALARAAEIRPDLELRNEAIACMALADLRLVRPLPEQLPGSLGFQFFDAPLERCATSDAQGNISIRRTDEGREILHLPGPGFRAWIIKFSPDGRLLAAKYHSENRMFPQLYVWDLRSRQAALKIPAVCSFDISGDSRWLAVGQPEGTIQLYDLTSAKGEFKALPRGPLPNGLAFHPDGRSLAVWTSQPRVVQVLDVQSGKVLMTFSHPSAPLAVAWHPDGKLLAVGCSHPDRRVHLWDIPSMGEKTLEGHQADVVQVVFNPASDLLLSSSWDGTTRLWDPFGARQLITADGSVEGVSIDGRQVAMSGGLWELAPGGECRMLYGHRRTGKGPWSTDFSPDGRVLASASSDGVRLWDVAAGKEIAWLPVGECRSVHFHPSDGSLLTYGPAGVYRWPVQADQAGGTGSLRIGPPQSVGLPADVRPGAASLSADGRTLAVADNVHGQVLAIDLESKKLLLRGPQTGISRIALSPDGRWAAGSPRGVASGTVRVWDVQNGKAVADLAGPEDVPVAFSPDGQWLVNGGNSWHVGSWQSAEPIRAGNASGSWNAVCFSPDGKMLALGPWRGAVRLVDPATGQEVATLSTPGKELITNLAFSPDGSLLAVCCHEVIQVWDLRLTRRQLKEMNLDWEMPPYPRSKADPTPLQVKIDFPNAPLSFSSRKGFVHQQALALVESLFAKVMLKPDVVDSLRKNETIGEEVRQEALALAEGWRANGNHLNSASWAVVRKPGEEAESYRRALLQAEEACRLDPENGDYLNTLGVAQYRAGKYQQAVATLSRSNKLNAPRFEGAHPADLAFLAMAHHRLGQKQQTRDYMKHLREAMKKPRWAGDEQALTFLREAEGAVASERSGSKEVITPELHRP
jgi:serine/threonine protein kinase/WD40 repeat protein